jgi:hypothetical protein
MNTKIKVGFCVAYDWHLLQYALPAVYPFADEILLSLDVDRISWSNNAFQFDNKGFSELITTIDREKKITLFEDNFHNPGLSPMENEIRQRNLTAEKMRIGGWHIQLDCDEYFLNFKDFTNYLKSLPSTIGKINVCCPWITLFKRTADGFLYILPSKKSNIEFIQIATNDPIYKYGRRNGHVNLYTGFPIVHQSWARSEQEISDKLKNWGHKNDFDANQYISLWKSVDDQNYRSFQNFHPIEPTQWSALAYCPGKLPEDLMENIDATEFILSDLELRLKNSRTISRFKRLFNYFR